MKTPEQWMEEIRRVWGTSHGLGMVEDMIAAIQRDAIAHEYGRYTGATLTTPGWYFWYPADKRKRYDVVEVSQDLLKDPQFRELAFYAGMYLGPIETPKLEDKT